MGGWVGGPACHFLENIHIGQVLTLISWKICILYSVYGICTQSVSFDVWPRKLIGKGDYN